MSKYDQQSQCEIMKAMTKAMIYIVCYLFAMLMMQPHGVFAQSNSPFAKQSSQQSLNQLSVNSIELGVPSEIVIECDTAVVSALANRVAYIISFNEAVHVINVRPVHGTRSVRLLVQVFDPKLMVIACGVVQSQGRTPTLLATMSCNIAVQSKRDSLSVFPMQEYVQQFPARNELWSLWQSVTAGTSVGVMFIILHQLLLWRKRSIMRAYDEAHREKGISWHELHAHIRALQSASYIALADIEHLLSVRVQVRTNVVQSWHEILPDDMLAELDTMRFSGEMPSNDELRRALALLDSACSARMQEQAIDK